MEKYTVLTEKYTVLKLTQSMTNIIESAESTRSLNWPLIGSGPKWTVLMDQSERSLKWTVILAKVNGIRPKWTFRLNKVDGPKSIKLDGPEVWKWAVQKYEGLTAGPAFLPNPIP